MNHLNVALFQWIAGVFAQAPWLLAPMRLAAVDIAYAVAAISAWRFLRQPAQRRYIAFVLLACGLASVLSHGIASAVGIARPFVAGLSPLYISHSPSAALPSTHASVLMLIALLYCHRPPLRRMGIAMLVLAVVNGVARVFVGVHFPLDIVAGFLLAVVLAEIFWLLHAALHRHLAKHGPAVALGHAGGENFADLAD